MYNEMPMGLRFSILHRSFRTQIDKLLTHHGLTGAQFGVLGALARLESEGCAVCQRDLENVSRVTHPTMTEILKRLEKNGFIACTRSESDRRSKLISGTDRAHAVLSELSELEKQVFGNLCRGLTEEQIKQLDIITAAMLENTDCCKERERNE